MSVEILRRDFTKENWRRRRLVSNRIAILSNKTRAHLGFDGEGYSDRGNVPGAIGFHGARLDSIVDLALYGSFNKQRGELEQFFLWPNPKFNNFSARNKHVKEEIKSLGSSDPDYDPMLRGLESADTQANSAEMDQLDERNELSQYGVVYSFSGGAVREDAIFDRDAYDDPELILPSQPEFRYVHGIFPSDKDSAIALNGLYRQLL